MYMYRPLIRLDLPLGMVALERIGSDCVDPDFANLLPSFRHRGRRLVDVVDFAPHPAREHSGCFADLGGDQYIVTFAACGGTF